MATVLCSRKTRQVIDVVAMSEQDSGMAARVANDQIVPIDLEEASPSKKARQSGVLVECDIVATIQQAVASSVSAHLAPVTQTLQLLQEGQKQQGQKLRDIEAAQALTSSSLVDLQEAHTKRMDSLQAEFTQLQKSADSSRPTSPTSPGAFPLRGGFRAVAPTGEPSFDVIVGGWKEGRSTESILEQLNKILSDCGVSSKVQEVALFQKTYCRQGGPGFELSLK